MNDECPLLDELQLIAPHADRHFILVDDARLFLTPPPRPHKPEQWPTLDQIYLAMAPRYPAMFVIDDVVLLAPAWSRKPVQELIADYTAS